PFSLPPSQLQDLLRADSPDCPPHAPRPKCSGSRAPEESPTRDGCSAHMPPHTPPSPKDKLQACPASRFHFPESTPSRASPPHTRQGSIRPSAATTPRPTAPGKSGPPSGTPASAT